MRFEMPLVSCSLIELGQLKKPADMPNDISLLLGQRFDYHIADIGKTQNAGRRSRGGSTFQRLTRSVDGVPLALQRELNSKLSTVILVGHGFVSEQRITACLG